MGKTTERKLKDLRQQYINLGIATTIDFIKFTTMSIVHHSTKIEGCTLDELDTQILLEDGLTAKGKPLLDHLMMEDNYKAFKHARYWAGYKGKVTKDFIQELGAMVMYRTGGIVKTPMGAYDTSIGDLRRSAVRTDSRYFPDWTKVPKLLASMCAFVNSQLDEVQGMETLRLATELHYMFVDIHPFGDGNGRVGRILMNYVQMYHGEPSVKIFAEDRKEYIAALQESDTESCEPLYAFIVEQQIKFLSAEIEKFEAQ